MFSIPGLVVQLLYVTLPEERCYVLTLKKHSPRSSDWIIILSNKLCILTFIQDLIEDDVMILDAIEEVSEM